jgi:uncharacterized protein YbjT (DUF2867 family)
MILVTGPTGTIGSALLPLLVEAGVPVRALAHSEASHRQIEAQGVEACAGDLDDLSGLAHAMDGCERLFLLSPPAPDMVEREQRAIDVAARVGVRHVVALSAMGASDASQAAVLRAHAAIDAHLTASDLDHTLLRPAGFMQSHLFPVDTVRRDGTWYGIAGDGASGFVDARDVAAVAAHVLTADGHEDAVYEVTGPAAISMPEAASELGKVLDTEVRYVDVPPDDFRPSLLRAGLPEWLADSIIALHRSIREGHAATVTNEVEKATGRPARSYRQFAEDHRDAFFGT